MDKKENYLRVRVTASELAELDAAAAKLNMSRSEYLRTVLRIKIELESEGVVSPWAVGTIIIVDDESLPQLIRQIRAWGHHYNQAVFALNTLVRRTALNTEDSKELIERCYKKLDEIEGVREELTESAEAIRHILLYPSDKLYRRGEC